MTAIHTSTTLGFGQKLGQIMQMAYVVEDIRASMAWWMADARTGPWFLLDHFLGPDQTYRGAPSRADVTIAMAFAGHMQIELIQPLDDHPSVYRDVIAQRGYGFHHVGIACADVDAEIPGYQARGYTVAYRAAVPTGGAVAYLDNGRNQPGMVELIPVTPGMDETFTRFWRASVDWDGSDPVRPFA
ncbi:VOC family protein [Novosphingobium sp.]|uniref:VOC family protein n=1 Tax=Novosphingobium sp. TaxID=1874826 RepID=UPI00334126CF